MNINKLKQKLSNWYKRKQVILTLQVLTRVIYKNKYNNNSYRFAKDILPNIKFRKYENSPDYISFTIDKITYTIPQQYLLSVDNIIISVNDIIIYCEDNNDNKIWRHTLPNKMIDKMYEESKIINKYINQIETKCKECKYYKGIDMEKYKLEQEELNNIFKEEIK